MKIPQVTTCEITIHPYSRLNDSILCIVEFNGVVFSRGLQNALYTMPSGRYRAVVYKGEHQHERILLENVPHHSGVEIHEANKATQLRGCTAVGFDLDKDYLGNSVIALAQLVNKVKQYNVCFVNLLPLTLNQPA